MQGYSRAIVMGNLTRDPTIRFTPNGTAVASIAVAVNRRYRSKKSGSVKGEIVDEVSYFDVELFGRQAEVCGEKLRKGDSVLVDGRMRQERYQAKDGSKRSAVRIVSERVCFLSKQRPPAENPSLEESSEETPVSPA